MDFWKHGNAIENKKRQTFACIPQKQQKNTAIYPGPNNAKHALPQSPLQFSFILQGVASFYGDPRCLEGVPVRVQVLTLWTGWWISSEVSEFPPALTSKLPDWADNVVNYTLCEAAAPLHRPGL